MVLRAALAAALLVGLTSVKGAYINAPLPVNTYITYNNLNWAWASPLPASQGLDLSIQGAFGWRIPTAGEMQLAPLATNFIFGGANVPLGGTDPVSGAHFKVPNATLTGAAACAAPYFSTSYHHCDWGDGTGQPAGPWAGLPTAGFLADQLVVRSATVIPVPATLSLLGSGLMGLVLVARKYNTA